MAASSLTHMERKIGTNQRPPRGEGRWGAQGWEGFNGLSEWICILRNAKPEELEALLSLGHLWLYAFVGRDGCNFVSRAVPLHVHMCIASVGMDLQWHT